MRGRPDRQGGPSAQGKPEFSSPGHIIDLLITVILREAPRNPVRLRRAHARRPKNLSRQRRGQSSGEPSRCPERSRRTGALRRKDPSVAHRLTRAPDAAERALPQDDNRPQGRRTTPSFSRGRGGRFLRMTAGRKVVEQRNELGPPVILREAPCDPVRSRERMGADRRIFPGNGAAGQAGSVALLPDVADAPGRFDGKILRSRTG